MVTDMSGGNWYRLWAIHQTNVQDENGERLVGEPVVVIVSDDKTHPYEIPCASDEEADKETERIAKALKKCEQPLWTICNKQPEDLPEDVRAYEMKRLNWYWKAPDVV